MRGGLAWLDLECQRRFDKTFVGATDAERHAVLDDIAGLRRAEAGPDPRPGVLPQLPRPHGDGLLDDQDGHRGPAATWATRSSRSGTAVRRSSSRSWALKPRNADAECYGRLSGTESRHGFLMTRRCSRGEGLPRVLSGSLPRSRADSLDAGLHPAAVVLLELHPARELSRHRRRLPAGAVAAPAVRLVPAAPGGRHRRRSTSSGSKSRCQSTGSIYFSSGTAEQRGASSRARCCCRCCS